MFTLAGVMNAAMNFSGNCLLLLATGVISLETSPAPHQLMSMPLFFGGPLAEAVCPFQFKGPIRRVGPVWASLPTSEAPCSAQQTGFTGSVVFGHEQLHPHTAKALTAVIPPTMLDILNTAFFDESRRLKRNFASILEKISSLTRRCPALR